MTGASSDDVIRIRVDTARVVQDFLDLLAAQAAEGETRAPAKPRATAVYRELAPFRLVEYTYVDDGVGEVEGAYIGLPDGTIYSAGDELPEEAVDRLVDGSVSGLSPVYVYVVLREPAEAAAIDHFLAKLSAHVDMPVVGVFRDGGRMVARAHGGDGVRLKAQAERAAIERAFHLSKDELLGRFRARAEAADGRGFACVPYGFAKHVVEFTSPRERDDFVLWTRLLADWMYTHGVDWHDLGLSEIFRPAEPVVAPRADIVTTPVAAPGQYQGGRAWRAYGGADAAGAKGLVDKDLAADYWHYVQGEIGANEAGSENVDGWVVR